MLNFEEALQTDLSYRIIFNLIFNQQTLLVVVVSWQLLLLLVVVPSEISSSSAELLSSWMHKTWNWMQLREIVCRATVSSTPREPRLSLTPPTTLLFSSPRWAVSTQRKTTVQLTRRQHARAAPGQLFAWGKQTDEGASRATARGRTAAEEAAHSQSGHGKYREMWVNTMWGRGGSTLRSCHVGRFEFLMRFRFFQRARFSFFSSSIFLLLLLPVEIATLFI